MTQLMSCLVAMSFLSAVFVPTYTIEQSLELKPECVSAGCKVTALKRENCATITGDVPPADSDEHGKCKCDGIYCILEKSCYASVTLTFSVTAPNVLCKGTMGYGHNEQVTLSVTACGDAQSAEFDVRANDCTGAIQCGASVTLECPLCGPHSCQ